MAQFPPLTEGNNNSVIISAGCLTGIGRDEACTGHLVSTRKTNMAVNSKI